MESIFGGLIEFEDVREFDDFVREMDKKQAVLVLEKTIEFGLHNRLYNLMEANMLYKCLSKLKENADKNQGDHLHNDDTNGDIS
jgi:ribosomal protein L22